MKPIVLRGPVPAAGTDSLLPERYVEALIGARAKEPDGPMLPTGALETGSMVNFINGWLMELGLTTA